MAQRRGRCGPGLRRLVQFFQQHLYQVVVIACGLGLEEQFLRSSPCAIGGLQVLLGRLGKQRKCQPFQVHQALRTLRIQVLVQWQRAEVVLLVVERLRLPGLRLDLVLRLRLQSCLRGDRDRQPKDTTSSYSLCFHE